jgi:hypothetical protein
MEPCHAFLLRCCCCLVDAGSLWLFRRIVSTLNRSEPSGRCGAAWQGAWRATGDCRRERVSVRGRDERLWRRVGFAVEYGDEGQQQQLLCDDGCGRQLFDQWRLHVPGFDNAGISLFDWGQFRIGHECGGGAAGGAGDVHQPDIDGVCLYRRGVDGGDGIFPCRLCHGRDSCIELGKGAGAYRRRQCVCHRAEP